MMSTEDRSDILMMGAQRGLELTIGGGGGEFEFDPTLKGH